MRCRCFPAYRFSNPYLHIKGIQIESRGAIQPCVYNFHNSWDVFVGFFVHQHFVVDVPVRIIYYLRIYRHTAYATLSFFRLNIEFFFFVLFSFVYTTIKGFMLWAQIVHIEMNLKLPILDLCVPHNSWDLIMSIVRSQ